MCEDIYSKLRNEYGIEVKDYVFERDYVKEPLKCTKNGFIKKIEDVSTSDLYFLYKHIKLTIGQISDLIGVSKEHIYKQIKRNNFELNSCFYKTITFNYKNIENHIFERDYITDPIRISKSSKESQMPTKSDLRYLYYERDLSITEISNIFGVSSRCIGRWINKCGLRKTRKEVFEKIKNTKVVRYGRENVGQFGTQEHNQSIMIKYGVSNPMKIENFKNKIKETNNKKYGHDYFTQTDEFKQKIAKNADQIKKKRYETMKNRGYLGANTSKEEILLGEELLRKFFNVKKQYKTDLYPFPCDFYIPELDLYIEYQGYWTHGFEPYVGTDKQLKKVAVWKQKNSKAYNRAMRTWTIIDPLKRKIAKDNNLNWIEFFTIDEFYNWYNKIT